METFTYFSYGSNMLAKRLKKRCSSARFIGAAYIKGQTLAFSKKSEDCSGKTTVVQTDDNDAVLYGILYEINVKELDTLDNYEGPGYNKNREFVVQRMDSGEKITTTTYIASSSATNPDLLPYDWYKDLVVAGARQGNLPEFYISWLENFPSKSDLDKTRKSHIEARKILEQI